MLIVLHILSFNKISLEIILRLLLKLQKKKRERLKEICSNFLDNIATFRFSENEIMVEQKNFLRDINLKLIENRFQSCIAILPLS